MASTTAACMSVDKPFRPPSSFKFPTRRYGERDRSCQHSWFKDFNFLHYDIARDVLFCHTCQRAVAEKKILSSKRIANAFVTSVFAVLQLLNKICSFQLVFQTGKMDLLRFETIQDHSIIKRRLRRCLSFPNKLRI